MELPSDEMLEMFRALMRLRKAWHSVRPAPLMSKSLFTTLMAIAHAGDATHPDYVPVKLVNGAMAVTDLSVILHQSLPVISQRIRALEKLSYLQRVTDEADRRISRVKLTEKGLKEVQAAHEAMKAHMDGVMSHFGEENIPALIDMLNKLAYAFEKTSGEETELIKEKNV